MQLPTKESKIRDSLLLFTDVTALLFSQVVSFQCDNSVRSSTPNGHRLYRDELADVSSFKDNTAVRAVQDPLGPSLDLTHMRLSAHRPVVPTSWVRHIKVTSHIQ